MTVNAWVELTARACHEANRALQLWDDADQASPSWDKAPNWQKESSIEGVLNALRGQTPEELHDSWAKKKLADGWTYGPIKNAEFKQHPCLVPYMELPHFEVVKDMVFHSIVKAFKDHQVIGDWNLNADIPQG